MRRTSSTVRTPPPTVNGMNTCVGDPLDDVHHRVAVVGRRGDVEEHELVGAFGVVARRELDGIAGVADARRSARPSRRGPRRRRGTGSRGLRARGDPLLDREAAFVDRRARRSRPRAADRRPRARRARAGRRSTRRRRSRSPARSTASEHRRRAARGRGPPSMPSRADLGDDERADARAVEAPREVDEVDARCVVVQPWVATSRPRASSPTATRPGNRAASSSTSSGCSTAAVPTTTRSTPASSSATARLDGADATAALHLARHRRADRVDDVADSVAARRARRRGRRRGSSARPAASKLLRDRDGVVAVDASRAS